MIEEARAVVLGALLRETLARIQALGVLYRRLAVLGQPEAIRPALLELASAKEDLARENRTVAGAIERGLGDGAPPAGTSRPQPGAEGPLDGLRGEGLAAACSAERGLQSLLREAGALATGSPWAPPVADLAHRAADHRRRVLALYQRYS